MPNREEGTHAHGIALFVADHGYEALSEKQHYVYDKEVVPSLKAHARRNGDIDS